MKSLTWLRCTVVAFRGRFFVVAARSALAAAETELAAEVR
jgi:hypothetical protein